MPQIQERLEQLKHRASKVAIDVNARKGSLDKLYDMRRDSIQKKEDLEKKESLLQKTMSLFKTLSEAENEKSKNVFINLINFGLRSIFGEGVKFDLERKDYATGTFYSPILVKNGEKEEIFSSGGGVIDVVSFLCRVVVLVSFYKKSQRVLRLDEPFKNLSVEYREKALSLIKQLSDQFDIQFIMVTHLTWLKEVEGAVIYKVSKGEDGYSRYEKDTAG
jgi:DNA repair exonuclease SbcCD ATPase subunit